ncbi:MAG: hypothetical protein PGN08_14255 [Sphingomonas taxi]
MRRRCRRAQRADRGGGRAARRRERIGACCGLHPDDLPLVAASLPKTIFAAGDAALARGSFVLESASTLVEDGPELWLGQLAAAIDRVPVPPLTA